MDEAELEQRVEEIELAVADLFESPKAPSISSYDEGTRLFIQVSWVIESHADTTLDSRCVVTMAFAEAQFARYAALDTAHRKAFQERLRNWVREQFAQRRNAPGMQEDCSLELDVPDALF